MKLKTILESLRDEAAKVYHRDYIKTRDAEYRTYVPVKKKKKKKKAVGVLKEFHVLDEAISPERAIEQAEEKVKLAKEAYQKFVKKHGVQPPEQHKTQKQRLISVVDAATQDLKRLKDAKAFDDEHGEEQTRKNQELAAKLAKGEVTSRPAKVTDGGYERDTGAKRWNAVRDEYNKKHNTTGNDGLIAEIKKYAKEQTKNGEEALDVASLARHLGVAERTIYHKLKTMPELRDVHMLEPQYFKK